MIFRYIVWVEIKIISFSFLILLNILNLVGNHSYTNLSIYTIHQIDNIPNVFWVANVL